MNKIKVKLNLVKIIEEGKSCLEFKDQIDFLKRYNTVFTLFLDNDDQYITLNEKYEKLLINNLKIDEEYIDIIKNEINKIKFNDIDYFGNADGVLKLFEYCGLSVEEV